MHTFHSTRNKVELHRDYQAIFVHNLDKKWEKHVAECPQLANAMLPGMTAKKILVAEFKILVRAYFHYIDYMESLSKTDRLSVQCAANKVFTYNSFSSDIATFLINPQNKYIIHNCVYCDTTKVTPFDHKGRHVRAFHNEHILDKGTCPLVSLSLYNFVPACGICNGHNLKGNNTIGDSEEEVTLLSPTNPHYDFWHKVLFVVNPKVTALSGKIREQSPNDYEIDFLYKDIRYEKSVQLFALKARYNTNFLMEALRWLDKKDRMTNVMLEAYAKLEQVTPEEIYNREFRIEIDRNENNPLRKLKEDLIGETPW